MIKILQNIKEFCPIDNYEYFTLIVKTISYCNFNCEYCCENCNFQIKKEKINYNDLYIFIINNYYFFIKFCKYIKISLYGGEPTLHSGLLEFCEKIFNFNKNIYLELYTNFSQDIIFYKMLLYKFNIKIICTYHNNKLNTTKNFYQKIISIDKYYLNNIFINIMYEKKYIYDNIQLYYKLIKFLKENNIILNIYPFIKIVRDTNTYKNKYTQLELENFKKIQKFNLKPIVYTIDNQNNKYYYSIDDLENFSLSFNKWLCNAGKTSLYINCNGNIYKCVSQIDLEKKQNKQFFIGNIKNKYKKINISQNFCQTTCCTDYDSKKINIFKIK